MEKDCLEQKLTTVDPQERSTWRSGVRSLKGGPLMWMIPLPLNQKSVYGREAQANMEETDRERFL